MPVKQGVIFDSRTGRPFFQKDAFAIEDVEIDWSSWASQEGTSVSSSTWTVAGPDSSLTTSDQLTVANVTRTVISGGTVGATYQLRNFVIFANGYQDARSVDARVSIR